MTRSNNSSIGVLDSGVGGLSIWREIIKKLPFESTIYLADSKYCPYGSRSKVEIVKLSQRLIGYNMLVKAEVLAIDL